MPGWNPGRYAKKTKNAYHWPWKSDGGGSTTRTFVKGLALLFLIVLVAGVLFNQSGPVRVFAADYNSGGYSHTRTPIYIENQNWAPARWNYNSTCVTISAMNMDFDYSLGTSGSKGNNCNSADLAINKAPVNFGTAAGKQLEMILHVGSFAANCAANCYSRMRLIFRTNSTLPNFKENYDAFTDSQARAIMDICPARASALCGANGLGGIWVTQAEGATVNGEQNDLLFSTICTASGAQTIGMQIVLNYTGGPNWAECDASGGGFNNNNVVAVAPTNILGRDYYMMIEANFDTTQTPTFNVKWRALSETSCNNPCLPNTLGSLGIWTVPSGCQDPLNKAACSAPPPAGYSAPSTSSLNLFDPVSWIVYLGKVMIWAAQQTLALVINGSAYFFQLWNGVAASIGPILQSIWSIIAGFFWGIIVGTLNTVGSLLGFSSLGTDLTTALTNFFSLLFGANGIFNAILIGIGDLANLVKNFALFFYAGFFFDFVVPLVTLFGLLFNLLAVTLKVLGLLFKGGTIGIQFLFLFDILWVLLGVNDEGTGFIVKEWWPLHKLIIVGIVQVGEFFLRMISQYIYWVITVVELAIEDVKPNVAVAG